MRKLAVALLLSLSLMGCQRTDLGKLTAYAKGNDAAGVKSELAKGFDPATLNSKDGKAATTPLHIAAENGNVDIIKLLLAAGINVNLRRDDGSTPLFLATLKTKTDAARLLLQNGASPNLGTYSGYFPLIVAVAQQNRVLSRDLVEHGANVSAESGPLTPIGSAAFEGDLETAGLLLSHGADINQSTAGGGVKPVDLAVKKDDKKMLLFLLASGGQPSSWGDAVQFALNAHDPVMAGLLRAAERNQAVAHQKAAVSPQAK